MRSAIIVLLLAFALKLSANDGQSSRVLFLGNSVFYFQGGLGPSFEGFCRAANLEHEAVSQWTKPTHPHGIQFLDYGRIPLNLPAVAADKKIHEIIREGKFDYVILEGRRSGFLLPPTVDLPKTRGRHIPYAENFAALNALHRTIVTSGARTILYLHPGLLSEADHRPAVAQIYHQFQADLERETIDGKTHKVQLVPAISLWADALQRFATDEWYANDGHGTALARYASACLLYTYLTGDDPRTNAYDRLIQLTNQWQPIPEYTDYFARKEDAAWIKERVWHYYSEQRR